jgi:dipeptidyl aminopeptidase/acylaminoacyl peptidase
MKHLFTILLTVGLMTVADYGVASDESSLALKQIMADPDWIARSPENPYWSDDNSRLYYWQKDAGHKTQSLMSVSLTEGKSSPVPIEQLDLADVAEGDFNRDHSLKVYSLNGDVFIKNMKTGGVQPLTRTLELEQQAQFLTDGRVSFRQGNDYFTIDINGSHLSQLVSFIFGNEPKDWQEPSDFLGAQQRRLFNYIRKQQDENLHAKQRMTQRQNNSPFNAPVKVYFPDNYEIDYASLSPKGDYVFVALSEKQSQSRRDNMPRFITEDGYVENESVRTLVGQSDVESQVFYLVDVATGKKFELSTKELPGINRDPLASFKKQQAKKKGEKYKPQEKARDVYIYNWFGNGIVWNNDGSRLAVKLFSYDNKDRWLVEVDLAQKSFKTLHRLSDEAWINDWTFNQMGWLNNGDDFYYLSEESGYSHLYLKRQGKSAKALTQGKFEVSDLTLTKDDHYLYYRANKKHPGIYEVYRVDLRTGQSEAMTDLNGVVDYVLSPDEQQLALLFSTTTRPPELFVVTAGSRELKQLTHTVTSQFESIDWVAPQIVAVPSSHTKQPIYSRLYLPKDFDPSKTYPAVLFVHGAGYLQNSHHGWSGYFREFMFHTLLTRHGYVVLDMDYRASKGYGRNWRTAIYRQMGTPELEDLLDGKRWLVNNYRVDAKRVGIYGGSYGGFMTFMALFKAPGEFAAGAALRPVADWSSYNHGYTSNILNTPEVDPDSYNRSSPIEFAEGLSDPLLIAHGMVDDNVFFKDSVRLVQRLIELEKTPLFEIAMYPVEPHGFREPSSWLDEYTRIYMLFERYLK